MIKDLSKIKSKKTCFSFTSESTVSEIADMMDLKDIGAVPIINQDNLLIGILSERDIVRKLVKTGASAALVTQSTNKLRRMLPLLMKLREL